MTGITSQFSNQVSPPSWEAAGSYLCIGSASRLNAGGPYFGTINEPIEFLGNTSGGISPYQYHWDFGDENTSTQQHPQHTYGNTGNYTVTLTVTDSTNDSISDSTFAEIAGIGRPVIDTIQGGFGIKADIKNNGSADCSYLSWYIAISGGLISSGEFTQGTIEMLSVDETETIQASRLRGIGFITITVQVNEESKQASGFLLGPLVLRVTQH